MKKISEKDFGKVEKVECVKIRVCTKTRKCGNDEFYIEYMPISKYKATYVHIEKQK